MRGTFFNNSLEYKLEVEGESWHQGDVVNGTFEIVNHSENEVDLSSMSINLCMVNSKKLKAKDSGAFSLINSECFKEISLKPASSVEAPFTFTLADNAQVTETAGSLYLQCGNLKSPFEGGFLELNVVPNKVITDFLELFKIFFKFEFKKFKNKKEYIETKMIAPDSTKWASIQTMNLQTRMQKTQLELNFNVKVKQLTFDTGSMTTKDNVKTISRVLKEKDYSFGGMSLNQDYLKGVINEILEEVTLKPL